LRFWRARVGGASSLPDWHKTVRPHQVMRARCPMCGCHLLFQVSGGIVKVDVLGSRKPVRRPHWLFRPLFRFQRAVFTALSWKPLPVDKSRSRIFHPILSNSIATIPIYRAEGEIYPLPAKTSTFARIFFYIFYGVLFSGFIALE